MPYVTCDHCGLPGFVTAGWLQPPECPHCGLPVAHVAEPPAERVIAGSLALLRDVMDMDLALVTEVGAGQETIRHAAGEWPGIAELRGASMPFEETFCKRLLEGKIGKTIADVDADERVRDLQMACGLGVKAYVGTPVRASHARLYMLCCLAREARPRLGDRDVRVIEGFTRSLLDQLERSPA